MSLADLNPETRLLLEKFGFSEAQFSAHQDRQKGDGTDTSRNLVKGKLTVPKQGDVLEPEAADADKRSHWAALGNAALKNGEVGVIVLAGGMATRFGGGVKACVPVVDDETF